MAWILLLPLLMQRWGGLLLLLLFGGCLRVGFGSADEADDSAFAFAVDHVGAVGEPAAVASPSPSMARSWRSVESPTVGSPGLGVVWLTLEGHRGGYLQPLQLDGGGDVYPLAPAMPLPFGRFVRGIGLDPRGRLLVGNGMARQLLRVDVSRDPVVVVDLPFLPGPPDIHGVHGVCSLPGGNVIAGEFSSGSGNLTVELATSDRRSELTPLTAVYKTVPQGHTLSVCQATSDDELYLTEYDGQDDQNGDILHMVREEGGQWTERARFDISAFDMLHNGADNNSVIFSFVVHSNGSLYALPMRRFGSRLKRLIRCPAGDIRPERCSQLGELPADRSSVINGADAIGGAAELPDGNLLFVTNSAVYRYLLAEDRYEQLFDLLELELADDEGSDRLAVTRGLVVLRR